MDSIIEKTLYFVAQKGWTSSRQDFFTSLVTFLGETLGFEYALVDELLADCKTAKTVGLYAAGQLLPNMEYALEGTPCENVIGKSLCYYPHNIQNLFPEDKLLVEMNVHSYIGVPLWDSNGDAIGLIAVMGQQEFTGNRFDAEAVLQIVAVRCAHELANMRSEKVLQKSESKFKSLFEQAGDYILVMEVTEDRGLVITDANQAACKIHGYTREELLGTPIMDLDRGLDEDQLQNLMTRIMSGETVLFETAHLKKDGTIFPIEVSSKLLDTEGEVIRILAVERDIAERKRTEEEKIKLESQLHQAQKIESIGMLAGGVAHDFNNILSVILGHTEMALRKAGPSSPLISDLEESRKAANRAAELTRQLLTFARKQAITPKVLDLNESVTVTLKMLQRLIGENIQLSWNPAANLWPVKIDPSQLDQILANLCVNSRDAITGNGKISITTANTSWDEDTIASRPYDVVPGDYVQLSVSDDGCGMDKKTQAHMFEPFYTTKGVGSGTGLGLATVYGAAKQNHGFLTVYSEPELGTVFNVFFPRSSNTVEAKQEPSEKPLLRSTETILFVEDDEMLLSMATSMLEESGYTVLAAVTTDLAQTIAKEHPGPIHLLLSDVIMPVMNGKELSEKLLTLQPNMKVLFSSGYTADIISSQGAIEDKTNFLQKPFSLEALTTKVREVLDGH